MTRVALFMPGGVGDPSTPMHVPAQVNLVRRLSERFDLTVYSVIKPDGDSRPFLCGRAQVKFVRARYDDPMAKRIYRFVREFRRDHRRTPFALLHAFWALPCGLAGLIAARTSAIPVIVSLQGGEVASLPEIGYGSLRRQPSRSLTIRVCKAADTLTLLTEFQRHTLRRNTGIDREAAVIPYGAEREFFDVFERKRLMPPIRILHVSQMSRVKDPATLLEAVAVLRRQVDLRLRIIGNPSGDSPVETLCRRYGLGECVEVLGYVPHRLLPEHYRWAHLMLHPSRYEGEGMVIAEAAASGVVCCGTNVGLLSDLAPDRALSVLVGDAASLAGEVLKLIRDPERYHTLQDAAHAWACDHDEVWTARQYENLYDRLISLRTSALSS